MSALEYSELVPVFLATPPVSRDLRNKNYPDGFSQREMQAIHRGVTLGGGYLKNPYDADYNQHQRTQTVDMGPLGRWRVHQNSIDSSVMGVGGFTFPNDDGAAYLTRIIESGIPFVAYRHIDSGLRRDYLDGNTDSMFKLFSYYDLNELVTTVSEDVAEIRESLRYDS